MDFTMDNSKTGEIDNVTQTLISNANTETKHEMDETNNIFGMTGAHHLNDKLNNIIDLNDTSNPFTDFVKGSNEHNEDKEQVILSDIEKGHLENEGDMGPETSVDTTDDADNDTDPFECSTLSHSKETLPLSDNPFDTRAAPHSLDLDDLSVHNKPTAPISPCTDMPFDAHPSELIGQNNRFENLMSESDNFDAKSDDSQLGEDNIKTDEVTHEIRETTTVLETFEVESGKAVDANRLDHIVTDMDKETFEDKDIAFCGSVEMLQNRDDLAYNQFAEYIEQPLEKNLETTHETMMEGIQQTDPVQSDILDITSKADDIRESASPALDIPTSISPAPTSPVPDTNFDSIIHHEECVPKEFDKQPESPKEEEKHVSEFDEHEKLLSEHDHEKSLEEFGEHVHEHGSLKEDEKHFNEFDEHEKPFSEPEHEKPFNELEHEKPFNEPEHEKPFEEFGEHEKLKDLDEEEKHFDEIDKEGKPSQEFETYEKTDEFEMLEKPLNEFEIQKKPLDEFEVHEKPFGEFEVQEKQPEEVAASVDESKEKEKFNNDLDEHEKHLEELHENEKQFDIEEKEIVAEQHQELHETPEIAQQDNEVKLEVSEHGVNIEEPQLDNVETIANEEKLNASAVEASHEESLETHTTPAIPQEVEESYTKEILTESMAEKHQDPLPMEVGEETPLTTIDDNVKDSQLELHNEEQTMEDKLPSLEHNEPHIEPSEIPKEEPGIETKEPEIAEIAKESETVAVQEEVHDASLEECNLTVPRDEVEQEILSESKIDLEEKVEQSKSQETEELNKKEGEEEKTSVCSTNELSEEHFKRSVSDLDKEVEDMSSQLNPDAKEFVPTLTPVRVSPAFCFNNDDVIAQSPQKGAFSLEDVALPTEKDFENEAASRPAEIDDTKPLTALIPPHCLNGDDVVAQSPQKGAAVSMSDFQLPTANEFQAEISIRPSELSAAEPPQSLNLKEAMHEPEKEEISPAEQYDSSLNETSDIQSPVDTSLGKIEDMMNTVQMLPNEDEAEIEVNKTNGSLIPEANTNGDVPLITDISNLKLEEPKLAVEEKVAKTKVEKITKAPEGKKADLKPKTSSTGPKKTTSSTSASISDSAKAKTAATASKTKVGTSLTARPRTAPAPSSKPVSTEKKSSSNVISARAKTDTKSSPVGLKKLPLTKPKTDESKPAVRQTMSKVSSTTRSTTTTRTSSTTNATTTALKRTPLSTSTTRTASGPRPTLSPTGKSTTVTSTHKPAISPRSTVTSTLRKTEALKKFFLRGM
ncbi:titin-like isoform X3 [Hermetia illucens]|uniref:titin-like isoform X3 n=1 Tax=Hermetia illucens TaxID=343691 RepID=UPI0018CC7855|nr:titin-like isoform X3 [Hermetia illucens]